MDAKVRATVVMSVFSGVVAGFWLTFLCFWTRALRQSQQQAKFHQSIVLYDLTRPTTPFHIGALAYQVITVLFYAWNCVYLLVGNSEDSMKWTYCALYSLYIAASNFVGMSFAMGFGSIRSTLSTAHIIILSVASLADFAAMVVIFARPDWSQTPSNAVVIGVFVVVLLLGFRTLYLLTDRIAWCKRQGEELYGSTLRPHRRQLVKTLLLCLLLFTVMTVERYAIDPYYHSATAKAIMWCLYAPTATAINAWILSLMKPGPVYLDIRFFEEFDERSCSTRKHVVNFL